MSTEAPAAPPAAANSTAPAPAPSQQPAPVPAVAKVTPGSKAWAEMTAEQRHAQLRGPENPRARGHSPAVEQREAAAARAAGESPVELDLSRSEIDRIGGLPAGYAGKLLGNGLAKRKKRMWPIGLEAMLGTLGLRILLIEDEVATARTLALRVPVDRSNQRFGNVCRISAKLLPPPSQPAPTPMLTVVASAKVRRGGKYG
jgi:hypothetical protein